MSKFRRLIFSFCAAGCTFLIVLQSVKAEKNANSSDNSELSQNMTSELANLSEEERNQFMDAMKQIEKVPAFVKAKKNVQEANSPDEKKTALEAYNKLRHNLMVGIDPSLADVFAKLQTENDQKKSDKKVPIELACLTDAERKQFNDALNNIKNIPKFSAAKKAMFDAKAGADKKSASEVYYKIRRDLMVAVDPTLEPIFTKMQSHNLSANKSKNTTVNKSKSKNTEATQPQNAGADPSML